MDVAEAYKLEFESFTGLARQRHTKQNKVEKTKERKEKETKQKERSLSQKKTKKGVLVKKMKKMEVIAAIWYQLPFFSMGFFVWIIFKRSEFWVLGEGDCSVRMSKE